MATTAKSETKPKPVTQPDDLPINTIDNLQLGDLITIEPVEGRRVLIDDESLSAATDVVVDVRILRLLKDGDVTAKLQGAK